MLMPFQFMGYFSKTIKRTYNTNPFKSIYKNKYDHLYFFNFIDKFAKTWYLLLCFPFNQLHSPLVCMAF